MAKYEVHLSQADHNEKLANKLLSEPPFHDWAITAAFYSVIHYVEAWVFKNYDVDAEKHTETSIPRDVSGKLSYTPHGYREKVIERAYRNHKLSRDLFKCFLKLRDASQTARYLSHVDAGAEDPQFLEEPSSTFFSLDNAKSLVGSIPPMKAELIRTKS